MGVWVTRDLNLTNMICLQASRWKSEPISSDEICRTLRTYVSSIVRIESHMGYGSFRLFICNGLSRTHVFSLIKRTLACVEMETFFQ